MQEWQGYLHFLWSQFWGKGDWLSKSNAKSLASLPSLRLLKEQDNDARPQATRIHLDQPTRQGEDENDAESDDVWGFRDTTYAVDDHGVVGVTGSRYLLSGHRLPGLLPWASEALGVQVPLQPAIELSGVPIPEPTCWDEALVDELLRGQGVGLGLREDQTSSERRDRRRHGHGHTQEEMYALKYGAGLERIPDLVVYPETEAQVIGVVNAARKHGACIIPYGGGTNVTEALKCPLPGTDAPHSDDHGRMIVSLDTRRMDRLLWLDAVNRLACIEAGAVGRNIMAALEGHGFTMGHEPDSCEFSTLGGWIATNASGMKKNCYGNVEDMVLDMRVVTAAGEVLAKGGTHPRESTGSDPLRYMFGSEGTLGIVTSAVVKLHPLPEAMDYAAVVFPTWEHGVQFMYELQQSGCRPASVRLVDNEQFRMSQALKPAPPPGTGGGLQNALANLQKTLEHFYVITLRGFDPHRMAACTMVFEGSRADTRAQQRAVARLAAAHGGLDAGADNGRRGYQMTYNIAYIRDFAMRHLILAESFETSAAWTQVLALCDRVKARVRAEHAARGLPGRPLVSCRVTQLYGAGVAVYFYFAYCFAGVPEPDRVYAEIEEAARDEILAAGGSLSHHHGVGKLRQRFLGRAWSEAALEWRREVKRAVDPEDVFGCGNLAA